MDAIARPNPLPRADRVLFALLLVAACVAPASVRAQAGSDTLNLHWTAPGDNGSAGTASRYDLRVSTVPITNVNFGVSGQVPTDTPSPAGTRENVVARGLSRGTDYWFALKTRDAAGNWSPISNVLHWQWAGDRSPPATPQNVVGEPMNNGKQVHLVWRPGTEPDLAGYNVYRADALPGPFVRLNAVLLTTAEFADQTLPPGDADVWYQIASVDRDGNESAPTAPVRVIRNAASAAVKAWKLRPAYPNPAKLGEIQRLPIELPRGAGLARVEIVDGAGQRVRVIEVPLVGPGFGEIAWDGRNGVGALVVPGVYRAWLESDGERQFIRLVRTP